MTDGWTTQDQSNSFPSYEGLLLESMRQRGRIDTLRAERDTLRAERDEAVELLRSYRQACDGFEVGRAHISRRFVDSVETMNASCDAILSRLDAAKGGANGACSKGPGGNGGRHNMTWRRRKAGDGFYCDYCGQVDRLDAAKGGA